jgi:hypothetical protein
MTTKTWTHLFLSNKHSKRRVQTWTQRDQGCTLDPQLVHDTLVPFAWAEDLDLGGDETDCVAFADGVLQLPSVHALLSKRNELFPSARAEYAKVLVLRAVLELDGAFPGADVRSTRREPEVDDIGKGELLQELGTLCLVDTDHGGQGICIETTIGAVAHCFGRYIWFNESGDGVVGRCPVDESKGLLSTD